MKETEPMRFEEPDYAWIEIDQERCNRCGICVDMCPMDVLRMGSKGYPIMRYIDDCWYCDICVFSCPRQAVTLTDLPYLIR
jgi:NAD-dependent dihydropyrimidine dehydrogenase PreA subunit